MISSSNHRLHWLALRRSEKKLPDEELSAHAHASRLLLRGKCSTSCTRHGPHLLRECKVLSGEQRAKLARSHGGVYQGLADA